MMHLTRRMERPMKCPHCKDSTHPNWSSQDLGNVGKEDGDFLYWRVGTHTCPSCGKAVVALRKNTPIQIQNRSNQMDWLESEIVYPDRYGRAANCPPEVPKDIARDYIEAKSVVGISPQSAAALARRCLQQILIERNVSTKFNLSDAIDDALASGLPSHISSDLDAIREVGNFAAHPQKSQHSGEILPVEPHEAEWTLDVLDQLFDHYYVKPAAAQRRRDQFNMKLGEAGRKPLKGS
jgi:hypothetical protein